MEEDVSSNLEGEDRSNLFELKAEAKLLSGTRTGIKIRNFPQFVIDTMPQFGGGDAGPCPVELMLASLAGCVVETAIFITKKARIKIGDLKAETRAILAKDGQVYAITNVEIILGVQVSKISDKERAKECLNLINKYCIVTKSLENSLPITFSFVISN
ncbi:MAG: OsmC family protein [Thermoproteota archaeon]